MREIVVALVQMQPQLGETEANLSRMGQLIEEIAGKEQVDLILFPELVNTGYECGVKFTDLAETVPGHAINLLGKKASTFNVHIAFGMVEKKRVESVLYDTAILIGPDGELIDRYHKVHLRGEERLAFRAGYRFPLMETEFGNLGILLGWDLCFPEACRAYTLAGADLIAVLANWEADETTQWQTLIKARAIENGIFVCGVNRVGQEYTYTFGGDSLVAGPTGETLVHIAGPQESFGIARLDLDEIRKVREETQLLQCRVPQSYRELIRMY